MGATSLVKVTFEGLVTGIAAGSGVIPTICPNTHAAVHNCIATIASVRFMPNQPD
jgi:hypothetical protein